MRALVVSTALVVVLTAVATPASGSTHPGEPVASRTASAPGAALTLAQPSPDLPGLPPVSPDLSRVVVDSPAFRRAQASYQAVADAHAAEQARRAGLDHARADVGARRSQIQAQLASANARLAGLRTRLDAVDGAIADLAIGIYMTGGPAARVDAALATDQPAVNDADRRDVLGSASLDVLLAEREAYQARIDDVTQGLEALETARAELVQRSQEIEEERPQAAAAELATAAPVAEERVTYEAARTIATVKGVGFPLVALDAYYRAAASTAEKAPRCRLRWWAIAGVSRVEGHHGSYGGASLDALGDATQRIIGIPLDGTNNTQVVRDSDDGELDGDPVFDRAVGPMQFIPQTWTRFASDGNEDSVETPFNMYDATLAASRYLCAASGSLNADAGLRSAYFSYNHSLDYVERVLGFARFYERTLHLPEPPD